MLQKFHSPRKAQSSIEFVIIVGAMLFAFVIFIGILQTTSGNKNKEKTDRRFFELATNVQNELQIASKVSDGYQRTFNIPQDLDGLEYEIKIIDESIYINSTEGRYAASFPGENVTGQLVKGVNFIKKIDGVICLNMDPLACP